MVSNSEVASYSAWLDSAREADRRSGAEHWRRRDESTSFDHRAVKHRLALLRGLRATGDDRGLLFALDEGIHGNMDGIGNPKLWAEAKAGTKTLVEDYVAEIADALTHLAASTGGDIDDDERRRFFTRAIHCFGRSALLLSGSGSYLYFHIGVIRTLLEAGILPALICGSSGGSLVAAMACTHTDAELATLLTKTTLVRHAHPIDTPTGISPSDGSMISQEALRRSINELIPDLTFAEAQALTGRSLNISVAPAAKHQSGRLLNAITSPHVCIREAVLASCAVPGVLAPVGLTARDSEGNRVPYLADRKWVDGSLTHDLPSKRLSRLYFANHFIVSQAHPLIVPFALSAQRMPESYRVVHKAIVASMKAWTNLGIRLLDAPLSFVPPLQSAIGMAASVLNQEYAGEINIVRPLLFWPVHKVLGVISGPEIERLIDMGDHATWPKVEMIRLQTEISRRLSQIAIDIGIDRG